jgi:hypothetical protein
MRSAPASFAREEKSRILRTFTAMSPSTHAIWAAAIFTDASYRKF